MHRFLVPLVVSASLLCAVPALATVNHGDYIGTGVDFLQVSETTQSAGDPEPLWEAPTLGGLGDSLLFSPTSFLSSCQGATTASDTTESVLTTTVQAQGGVHIEVIRLQEGGDTTLTSFPPFGTPATNASASLSGTVTVTETTSGPITPVVIPFTGTFTPSATFSLPTNFGGSTWTGDIDVDVASVVPLATRADVSITNTLDTNCAPGATSALIQKKTVAGPAVSLLINPLECDVLLDKTCCVTQPALPDFGQCEGDMISMTLEFTGDKCSRSSNDQGRSFKCWGRRSIGEPADITSLDWSGNLQITPNTDVNHGDQITFTSATGTLGGKTKFKVRDDWWRKQYLKINTSCEKAFQCGDQFGAFEVTGFESTLGGVVDCSAPPPPPVCSVAGDPVGTPCDEKIVDMVLEYTGQDCQVPLGNPQSGEATCSGDATGATNVGIQYVGRFPYKQMVSPSSMINDGDRIRVTSTWRGGLFPNQEFLITDLSGVRQKVDFHTSCSQPFALGDEFGSLKVVEFTTKSGTRVALGTENPPADACEVPLAPPGPHCTGPLTELTLVYIGDFLGEGCTVSNPQGGYASCSGVADPGDPVAVVAANGTVVVAPEDQIEFGDLVTLTRQDDSALPVATDFTVTGAGGTQDIRINTSCWKALSLGDRFGSFVVFGMSVDGDAPITLGGNVQYQYAVTNPSLVDVVDNVAIDDDQLGEIVSGVTLQPGETQTFVQNATLFGTTTNVATATGDVGGDVCEPGVDQVTVTVTAPPPGAFSCSDPINELTLTWDGAQKVLVKAWDGEPLLSNQIGTFEDVDPGETIEVIDLVGFGTNANLEIFSANGVVKLGQSQFNLWCDDPDMNGVEDCGKRVGNTKANHSYWMNDWILEGMVDSDETLSCTPGVVGAPPDCGFGPELLLVLPGLMWAHRRRMRRG